jgi:hypothetical protein
MINLEIIQNVKFNIWTCLVGFNYPSTILSSIVLSNVSITWRTYGAWNWIHGFMLAYVKLNWWYYVLKRWLIYNWTNGIWLDLMNWIDNFMSWNVCYVIELTNSYWFIRNWIKRFMLAYEMELTDSCCNTPNFVFYYIWLIDVI